MPDPPAIIGRPSLIDAVLDHTADGAPITVAERIVAVVRSGGYIEHAAASAGVDKTTVYEWLRLGNRAGLNVARLGAAATLGAHEHRCMLFAHAVARAEGEFVAEAGARLAAAARGGRTITSTIERRDTQGNLIETVTKTEVTLPKPEVDQWRLERRFPSLYGRRSVEVSGPEGAAIPVEVRARELAESLRAATAKPTRKRRPRKLAPVPDAPEAP